MTALPITTLSQAGETALQRQRRGPFDIAYAYTRSADSRGDHVGQDFLAFSATERTLSFAVCDGVGQSFYGDLAARILGQSLVRWLSSWNGDAADPFGSAVGRFLDQLTVEATEQVADHSLPNDLPDMLREVLEEQRTRGSESMVVAGRVELMEGDSAGRVALVCLGDCRVRLWQGPAEQTGILGIVPNVEQRWSTLRGCIGGPPGDALGIFDGSAGNLTVVAYSDGLATLDDRPLHDIEQLVGALMGNGSEWTPDDDACFLCVNVRCAER